jgi:hypothetical protein
VRRRRGATTSESVPGGSSEFRPMLGGRNRLPLFMDQGRNTLGAHYNVTYLIIDSEFQLRTPTTKGKGREGLSYWLGQFYE